MMLALTALFVMAPPPFRLQRDLTPAGELQQRAEAHWRKLEETYREATGESPSPVSQPIAIKFATDLSPRHAGRSQPGLIVLRERETLDERTSLSLRHELAHQFLFAHCPLSASDPLFQEAFAVSTSGELSLWLSDGYVTLAQASAHLRENLSLDNGSLDKEEARRSLARLLSESASLHPAVARKLKTCASGVRFTSPLSVDALSQATAFGEAFVVLSRHSGEVLAQMGEIMQPMPFGSTLKPFVATVSGAPPIAVDRGDPLWSCGDKLPTTMTLPEALARSCNGYFLAWGKRQPAAKDMGLLGPLLLRLGLSRLPESIDEAIGLRGSLALSPWALAQAYRALAFVRPDVMHWLERTAHDGTLQGLASPPLQDLSLKTGTVRDADSRVLLGWIVGVDVDRVYVMAMPGRTPRSFATDFSERVAKLMDPAAASVDVQVFGLLDSIDVQARCDGVAITQTGAIVNHSPVISQPVMCLGAPWRLAVPSSVKKDRVYAGIFRRDVPPQPTRPDETALPRQKRARRGSDLIFSTTLSAYARGVLEAEDAKLSGEAKKALLSVIVHNAKHPRAHGERHPGRPVCDTTHCQVFLGTQPTRPLSLAAAPWLDKKGWLTFSRGGSEPWREHRTTAEVHAALSGPASELRFVQGRVKFLRMVGHDTPTDQWFDEPCEKLRSPLKLPACPTIARSDASGYSFEGVGAGHGEGLQVDDAKREASSAEALLQKAYGPSEERGQKR